MGQRWRVGKREGGRLVGTDETRETSKGNSRSGARPRPRVPGQGGKELNRGLGATSEEMVGGRRIGEDQSRTSEGRRTKMRTRMRTRIKRTRRRK